MARSRRATLLSSAPLPSGYLSFFALCLRLGVGISMLTHGVPKLISFGSLHGSFPDPIGMGSTLSLVMAIGAEVGCSVLLIFGLLTRFAVLPLIFTMCVAFFVVHSGDLYATRELAAVYILLCWAILALGSGKISLDYLIVKK